MSGSEWDPPPWNNRPTIVWYEWWGGGGWMEPSCPTSCAGPALQEFITWAAPTADTLSCLFHSYMQATHQNASFETQRRSKFCIFCECSPNEHYKWDATVLPPAHAFAEPKSRRLKATACEKRLLRAALYTSIHSFIFSPVPLHAGWKMWTSASAAECPLSVCH